MAQKIKIEILIGKVRDERGITLMELSKRSGISKSMLNYIENGKRDIKISQLIKIAEALEVRLEELYKCEYR